MSSRSRSIGKKTTRRRTSRKKLVKTNDNMKLIPKNSTSKHFIKLEFPELIVSQCEYSEGPVGLTFIRSKKDSSYFGAVSEYSNDLLRQNELVDVTPLKTPGSLERKK